MGSEELLRKLSSIEMANYSHAVDVSSFFRECENYIATLFSLDAITEQQAEEYWREWDEALQVYSRQGGGWKLAWSKLARLRAKLIRELVKNNILEFVSEVLNVDRIDVLPVEE